MKTVLATAPLALALVASLGACTKTDAGANSAVANETLLNDEDSLNATDAAGLDANSAGTDDQLGNAALDEAAGGNVAGGNETVATNGL